MTSPAEPAPASAPSAAWPAPYAAAPVHGRVDLPGSKSVTNRALLLAALAESPSVLTRPLLARDTRLMVEALHRLGTEITVSDDQMRVAPRPLSGPAQVDCGLAGTVMRFVPPVAALADGEVTFDGDARARERPMGPMLRALRDLGVDVRGATGGGDADRLPFRLRGDGRVDGGQVTLDASASSQFVSGLLLAGPRYQRGIDVRHDGKPIPSLPHVQMTVAMLRARGVEVDDAEPHRWRVAPGPVAAVDLDVEPDLSNAAPFLAAAVVTGGSVTVPRWPSVTDQAGDRLRDLVQAYGAVVTHDAAGLTVTGTGTVHGIDLDLHEVGELTPVLAAMAALAESPSYLRGVSHLRGHETDRLRALADELSARGARTRETDDGLEIRPGRLRGGLFRTYADHRMAHAGAVLGLRVPGVVLDDVAATAKTHERFAADWRALVA